MASRAARRLDPAECASHPALRAWRELGGGDPRAVVVVKEGRGPESKSSIFRIEDAGPGKGAVVAKRCPRETAALERTVYEEVLARLALPALRCFGVVADHDPRFAWLLLDAAEGDDFDAENPAHRASAARWLAALHTGAEPLAGAACLPERGADHYREHLRAGRRRIAEHFDHPALREPDRELLDAILRGLDVVESHWPAVEDACGRAPRTLVHGDFAARNVRVVGGGPRAPIWVFDWEVAGLGPPGVDLVRADLEVYAEEVRDRWPHLDVDLQARIGGLLRGCLAPIGWESLSLATPYVEGSLRNLASYRRRLDRCLAETGLGAGAPRRGRGARGVAALDGDPRAHPAALAWRRLGRSDAGLAEVACLRRKRGSAVFRLRGVGPAGSVVAKRTSRAGGDLERRVHEQVLPRLALRTLAFHGAVAEDDGLWLFLEDAGGESTLGPEDRRLLAAWLARLHTSAAPLCAGLDLPVRGADQHRERLRAACRALRDRVANPALLPADRWVLRELAGALERLDARWDAVEALCAQMPRTLVHGDLGPQNVRLRRTAGGAEILALDWETASVGPPAVDLVGVDPAVYAKVASREWPGATPQAVAGWKRCGALLRAITAIGWELPDLASPWVETPMARLRVYRQEIQEALAELASGVGAVAAPGAMR